MRKGYVVVFPDGKWYSNWAWETVEEAQNEMKEAIEYAGGDNWCEISVTEIELEEGDGFFDYHKLINQ